MSGGTQLRKRLSCQGIPMSLFSFLFISVCVLFFIPLCPLNSQAAEDISVSAQFNYINSNIETTNNDTGDVIGSDFTSFDQNYFISFSRALYPFMTFNAGSSFELDNSRSTSDELEITRKAQNIRPFVDIELRSPLYSAAIAYSKNQAKNEIVDFPVRKEFQESIDLSFNYRPAGLPSLKIFHNRAHNYNDPKTIDTITTQTTVKTGYTFKNLPVSYTYGRGEIDDSLADLKVVREVHEATASYSHGFFNDRLHMDTGYRTRYNITTVPGRGSGSVASPLPRSRGFFSNDPTPRDVQPAPIILGDLIDGNTTETTGLTSINLGSDADFQDLNIGLDFGFPVNVDTVYIYVDNPNVANVSNEFLWTVYICDNNTNTCVDNVGAENIWTLHATVFPASFEVFQNRFEISFPEATTQFIKVVVTPLSPISPDPELQSIIVTEIDASFTDIVTADQRDTVTSHNISLNLSGRLSDKTRMGYNFLYFLRETDPEPSTRRYSFSHSIYLNHIFNRIFTGSARVSRDESNTTTVNSISDSITYNYSANLRAAYLETFSQTLTCSYGTIDNNQGNQSNGSIFLRTNAALYKGWDAFLDVGYNWQEQSDASGTTSTFLTTQTSVVPNNKISLDATFTMVTSRIKEQGTTNTRRGYDARASYFPYRNLSLSFQVNVEEQSQQDEKQVLQRYAASWSPFRGGDLQILLSYSETRRPSDNQEERNTGPVIKWDINRYASLDVGYFYTTVETALEKTDLSTMTAKLTMTF